jgi:hypothetical protein
MAIEVADGRLKLKRELEAGWFQWVELPLPAVLTIQSGINKPRYATLKGIMAAKKKRSSPSTAIVARRADSPTQRIERIYVPQKTKKTEFITGQPKEIAAKLIEKLRHEARVICRASSRRPFEKHENPPHHRAARRQVESKSASKRLPPPSKSPADQRHARRPSSSARVLRPCDELAAYQLDEVLLVEHDLLEKYTPDGFSLALAR